MTRDQGTFPLQGFIVGAETEKAWMLYIDELGEDIWIPKSQIIEGDPELDQEIVIPLWLALKNGLEE